MLIVFWACLGALLWAYLGYPALLLLRARFAPRRREPPPPLSAELPAVSVVLAVRNAETELLDRVENLLAQDYPAARLDVLVVSNGSTDATEAMAAELAAKESRVHALVAPPAAGKAGALNAGVAASGGEILVFADARQRFQADAVRELVAGLQEPGVGAVSGRLVIGDATTAVVAGVGRYWQLETRLRLAESATGSVVGATGAIYAMHRRLFTRLPEPVILDDVYQPMAVVRQGYRVTLNPRAIARDRPSAGYHAEYARRVRTLVGNYELLRLMPWLLSPVRNPIFGRYLSHKLLRVLTPAFCIGLLVAGLVLSGWGYRAVAAVLLVVYVLGAIGLLVPWRPLALPSAFLLLHSAGIAALLRPHRRATQVWAR